MFSKPIPKLKYFLLSFDGRQIEAQLSDGNVYSKEPLTKSGRFHDDSQDSFYALECDLFFMEAGNVTVSFLREQDAYTADEWEEIKKESEQFNKSTNP